MTERKKYSSSIYEFGGLRHRKKVVGIYKITSPSGKVYIGQSWDILYRFRDYKLMRAKGNSKLFRSLLKYGWQSHTFEIIHELPADVHQSILDVYEILYMSEYRVCGIELLNLKGGGCGGKHTEKTKELFRKNNLGRKASDETKKKMSESAKGKVTYQMTQEVRDKIRQTLIGRKLSQQHCDNIKAAKQNESLVTREKKSVSARIGWIKRKGGES